MGSAAKFWPRALLKLGAKKETPASFVPATDIAARIVGGTTARPAPLPSPQPQPQPQPTSFDEPDLAVDSGVIFEEADPDLSRQAERFVPDKTSTTLTDKKGKTVRARIINLSATGVAIEADFRITPAGTVAMVGAKPVKAGRGIRGGHVFVFDKPLDPARCNKQVVL